MHFTKNKLFQLLIITLISITLWTCQDAQVAIEDMENFPIESASDKTFADVFKKLEGKWKGNLIVIKDPDPLFGESIDLENLKLDYVTKPGLTLMNNEEVTQTFTSQSPYFQKCDSYKYQPRNKKTEVETIVNKVQDGKLFRLTKKVGKPTVLEGTVRDATTIIWKNTPKGNEKTYYFQETVQDGFIELLGYEYGENERRDLGPTVWYYGKYMKSL